VQIDSNTGFAFAQSAGTATLTALYENHSDTSDITVTAVTLDRIDVNPKDESVAKNIKVQYVATGYFSDGTEQDLTFFSSWSSSDTGIATIAIDGLATSISAGTATIESTYNAVTGSTTLEVTPATLSFLKILPRDEEVVVGTQLPMNVTAYFSDGAEQDVTYSSSWSSSNNNVASVNSIGFVNALSVGTSIITATFEGMSVDSYITVTDAPLVRIEIIPNIDVVPIGGTVQFTARGYYSDLTVQDLTNIVTWRSSNDRVAFIESGVNGGFATAVGVGDTFIEANFDGIKQTARLQVLDVK
jgi:hypothetical protein